MASVAVVLSALDIWLIPGRVAAAEEVELRERAGIVAAMLAKPLAVSIEMEQGSSSARITADEASGFVFHYSYHSARGHARAWWQFAPKTYGNGIVLPGLSIEARGNDGQVDSVMAHIIESA